MEESRIDADSGIVRTANYDCLRGELVSIIMQDGTTIDFKDCALEVAPDEAMLAPVEASYTFNIVNAIDSEDIERFLTDEMSSERAAYIDDSIVNGTGMVESPYSSIEAIEDPPEYLSCICSILTMKLLEPIRLIRED